MRFLHITTILVLLANLAVAQDDSDNFSIKMNVSPMVRLNGGDFECTIQKRGNISNLHTNIGIVSVGLITKTKEPGPYSNLLSPTEVQGQWIRFGL